MKKVMLMLMFVVGLFASEYKCISVKKQVDGKAFSYNKDMLYAIEKEDTLKIALKNINTNRKAHATFYRSGGTTFNNTKFKIYEAGNILIYVSETPNKKGLYFITLETDSALEGFFCLKSKD